MGRVVSTFGVVLPVVVATLFLWEGASAGQDTVPPAEPRAIIERVLPTPQVMELPNTLPEASQRAFGYEGPPVPSFTPAQRDKQQPLVWTPPAVENDRSLPIDLPTALRLVNSKSLDVAIAVRQIENARAQRDFAKYLWLPTIQFGAQYFRHDGIIQNAQGQIFNTPVSAMNAGAGVNMVFTPSDAIVAALAARQVVRATQADLTATVNDTTLAVATAYFNVQQARGELFGAADAAKQADLLVKLTEQLAPKLVLPLEVNRARAEKARRYQAVQTALERWRTASAELARILRMDPAARIDPVEPPHLQVSLIRLDQSADDLIAIGLRNRPELASQQAQVQAAILRLKAERLRPLVPSFVLSGTGPGSTAASVFAGGNAAVSSPYTTRSDVGAQVVWTLQNMGLGNMALIRQRRAQEQAAELAFVRLENRVAAEVVQAFAQARSAEQRMKLAEEGVKDALDSMDKNFQGMSQTRRAGDLLLLLVRPQEAVAALQALSTAYGDYYAAVGDYNRNQFLLFRALGQPTHLLGAPLCSAP